MRSSRTRRTSAYVVYVLGAVCLSAGVGAASAASDAVVCFTSWRLGFSGAFVGAADAAGTAQPLRDQPRWTLHATISPEGSRVAYTTEESIYVYSIPTTETRRVAEPGPLYYHPEWSPDGQSLAYWTPGDGGAAAGFYTLDIETGRATHVTRAWGVARPAWSPGGDALAYESEGDIFIVDVNTGEQRAAFENGNAQDGHPSWAPDGDRFAFVSDRDGTRDVYTADINGENAKRLTKMGGAHWPRWTADGLAIVFSASHGGNSDIYMIDTEGGPPQRLTDHPSTDSYPSIFDPAALAVAPQDTALTQWASLRRGQ